MFWNVPNALNLSLKRCIKHSAWLYMLRFIATFLANWHITPWQHNTSLNRNTLWNSTSCVRSVIVLPLAWYTISGANDTQWWYICLITPNIKSFFCRERICLSLFTFVQFHKIDKLLHQSCHICWPMMYMWRHQTDRKTLREPNKIWRKETLEGKKRQTKNRNIPPQRVKVANI